MKFIPPLEISSKLMTLIEEAKTELILVSPYVKIDNWGKMKSCIDRAIDRNVKITFIARKNAEQDLTYIKSLKLNLILINDLHAKVYINDKNAIVTSQNITQSSDINSIEIGYLSENPRERKELIDFVNQYITPIANNEKLEHNLKINSKIKIVEKINYDNVISLKEYQVNYMNDYFTKKYSNCNFKKTSTYVFSNTLIPYADVMISSVYVIKIKKSINNIEKILEKILNIEYEFKSEINIFLLKTHQTYYYLEFIPKSVFNFNNLQDDYNYLTELVLKNTDNNLVR